MRKVHLSEYCFEVATNDISGLLQLQKVVNQITVLNQYSDRNMKKKMQI